MTIVDDPKFYHGAARLAEDPGDGESPWQGIDLEKEVGSVSKETSPGVWTATPRVRFNLRVHVGDEDMAFHGMTADELDRLGDTLKRLARAP